MDLTNIPDTRHLPRDESFTRVDGGGLVTLLSKSRIEKKRKKEKETRHLFCILMLPLILPDLTCFYTMNEG